jgi:uncharacterized protein (TIGR03118 family)
MALRTRSPLRTPRQLRVEPLEGRDVPAGYFQTNLASDIPGQALVHDPDLVNAWGIVPGTLPTSAWWISNEGTGTSTLYTGDVTQANGSLSPFVKSALTVTIPGGAPTGQVFNAPAVAPGVEDFFVSAVDSTGSVDTAPSRFITVSNTGHVTGWSNLVPSPPIPSRNAQLVATTEGALYTGLAIGSVGTADFLYAADFRNGRIDVFDGTFAPTTPTGDFVDPNTPDGYAPFNIQNLAGKLYVTYAQQDADDVPDKGHGFVSVFDTGGNFLNRLVTHDHLKAPWGLALAPANFGELSNALLVANHGDGRINAYDPTTGAHIDRVHGTDGEPIKIDGLLGLHFGNGLIAGDRNALYFTAGPDGGAHGLFGSLRVSPDAPAAFARMSAGSGSETEMIVDGLGPVSALVGIDAPDTGEAGGVAPVASEPETREPVEALDPMAPAGTGAEPDKTDDLGGLDLGLDLSDELKL